MSFSILQPLAFALLPLLGLFWFIARRSLADLTPRRRRVSSVVRSILFIILVTALADPRLLLDKNQSHLVIVADVSDSVGEESLKSLPSYLDLPDDFPHSLILFAAETEIVEIPEEGKPPLIGPLDRTRSRIGEALRFAEATVPADHAPTLLLLSDGRTDSDPLVSLGSEFAERGVRIHTVAVNPPDTPEMLVQSLQAPTEVNPQEPFPVEVEITSNQTGESVLEIFRNGALSTSKKITVEPGNQRFTFTERSGVDGIIAITASIRPVGEESDTIVDNNSQTVHIRTAGESRILLLSDRPESLRFLSRALRQEGFRLDIRPPTGLPDTLPGLETFDLVVFDNIAATEPSRRQMSLLREYVRDFGGGFLMLGGENSFGLGGYFQTPVDEILPVESEFLKDRETPSLAVVLVIDRSGSMSGEKIEMVKAASEATVSLLSPRDFGGVVAFDSDAFWVSNLQSATNAFGIINSIRSLSASGGTNISPGLSLAHQALAINPAKLKHIILLTDGQSQPGPFYDQTTRMAREGITVSTVAVGSGADQGLLEQIAQWGNGRFHYTADPSKVVQIFARETVTASRSAIQELPFLPVQIRRAEFLQNIDFPTAPFLLGFVATQLKPTADLWLATETGEPLLATWRYGLGKAGAFTSDARNRWAIDWLRWPDFGKFWSGIFRHLLRDKDLGILPVTLSEKEEHIQIEVDAIDASGQYVPDASGTVYLLNPSGESQQIRLRSKTPGTLSARWPAEAGTHVARIVLESASETLGSRTLIHDIGYPAEYNLEPSRPDDLAQLAKATGGAVDPTPDDLIRNDRKVEVDREIWPWLLIIALALFLIDLSLKRIPSRHP